MRERRTYVRSNGLIFIDYKGKEIEGKSSAFDVSGAGVRLTIAKRLKVGSQVELQVFLPSDSQPIKAKGKIAWVESCKNKAITQLEPQKQHFYIGIRFTAISEADKIKITNYVYKRFRYTK